MPSRTFMDCNHSEKHKKFSLRIILIAIFSVGVVVIGLWYYLPHLIWKYTTWRVEPSLTHLESIPYSPMPEIGIPEDWVEHSSGGVRFRLPADMFPINESSVVGFRNAHMGIRFVQLSSDLNDLLWDKLQSLSVGCFATDR